MILELAHTNLNVYKLAQQMVFQTYALTRNFPPEERYSLQSQMRRAALSTYLNIAEGSARKSSNEKRHFYDIALSSTVELDAAFDIAIGLNYVAQAQTEEVSGSILSCFKILSKLANR
jgi:four helix bundle protein